MNLATATAVYDVAVRCRISPKMRLWLSTEYPLTNSPIVSWKMYYDGEPVRLEFMGNRAVVPEPQPGQAITMTIERLDAGEQPIGVVLKVNGQNTIDFERRPAAECSKWVLNESTRKIEIAGFQQGMEVSHPFVIKAPDQLRADEVDYGANLGAITIAVFQTSDRAMEPRGRPELCKRNKGSGDHRRERPRR